MLLGCQFDFLCHMVSKGFLMVSACCFVIVSAPLTVTLF